MEEKTPGFPLKIDIGAKAELKAEIPTASTGRLVDALTDLIRPFSEARGLRADQIRLQREDVLIEIAKKAHRRLEIENAQPNSIPLRLMIPFLERASLTDPSDETLKEAWAALLHSAARKENANYGIFIDVLSKLDPAHIEFLEFISLRDKNEHPDKFLDRDRLQLEEFVAEFLSNMSSDIIDGDMEGISEKLSEKILRLLTVNGCAFIGGGIDFDYRGGPTQYFELEPGIDFFRYPESIFEALEGLGLVRRHSVKLPNGRIFVWLEYCTLTVFGLEFFQSCH